MINNTDSEKFANIIQMIMVNHLFGWLRLPMSNLLVRNDIIRFCCSRSWQTNHILKLLFAINKIEDIKNYKSIIDDVKKLPLKPENAVDRLLTLACSNDFQRSAETGFELIIDSINLANIHYPQIRGDAFFRLTKNEDESLVAPENKIFIAESASELYKTISGVEALIIEGSLALGMQDETSDIDLVAYCSKIPDIDVRKKRLMMIDPKCFIIPQSDRFTLNNVYVHVDFETITNIENTFGIFPQSICKSFGLWEAIQIGKVIWDPKQRFSKWKDNVLKMSSDYGNQFIIELTKLLLEEKRQFDVAVDNNDYLYCSLLLGNILTLYFQILGVMNYRFLFFPKWINNTLKNMNHKPDNAYNRFIQILSKRIDYNTLREYSNELQKLINELLELSKMRISYLSANRS
jgi:hypothetical protein